MKDLRAQRWFVAGWAGVLLAVALIEGLKLDGAISGAYAPYQMNAVGVFFLIALTVSREVLGWLLAVRIVHADPVGDTNAFWLTRPLSRTMLMASKLGLLAVLFFVVPGLAAAVVFLANDVAPGQRPRCIAEWWMFDAVLLLPFVLLATLTRDMARIGLAATAGAAAWLFLVGFATFTHGVLEMTGNAWVPVYRTMALTTASFGVAIAVLSLALIVWQYWTRRTAVTAWAALASIVALVSVAVLPSVRFMSTVERPAPVVDNRWTGASRVSIDVPVESIRTTGTSSAPTARFADRSVRLIGDVVVAGAVDDVLIDVADGHGTLQIADRGKTVPGTDVNWFGFSHLARLALRSGAGRTVFERVLGARIVGPSYASWNALSLARIKGDLYADNQGRHASYQADLVLAAYHLVVSPAIPTQPGRSIGLGSMGVTLLSVGSRPEQPQCWQASIRETDARAILPPGTARLGYVLRNRRMGEFVPLFSYSGHLLAQGMASTFLAVSNGTVTLDCSGGSLPFAGGGTPAVDRAWLADAELLIVGIERLGTFKRHVEVRDFVLPDVK
jgi:hypothetical protein